MSNLKVFDDNKKDNLIFGKFRAIVTDIKDPEKLGRIKVKLPEIYGNDQSPWAWPCLPYGGSDETGFFFLPEKEAGVWIEFEQGHVTNPIWTGVWWTKLKNNNEVPDEATIFYGKSKIIKTKAGHTIEMVDELGEEKIVITEGKHGSQIILKDGKIELISTQPLVVNSNNEVQVSSPNVSITGENITVNGSSSITLNSPSLSIG